MLYTRIIYILNTIYYELVFSDMINHAHITQDNILQIGKPGGILDVWNLKTKKRMSNASLNMERSAANNTGIFSFSVCYLL